MHTCATPPTLAFPKGLLKDVFQRAAGDREELHLSPRAGLLRASASLGVALLQATPPSEENK